MRPLSPRLLVQAAALAAVLAGGCLMSKPPAAPPTASVFFTSCKDWDTIVARAAAGAGCAVESQGSFGGGGVGRGYRHETAGRSCILRGDRPAAGQVLQAVQAEVQARAQQTGAQVIEVSEGKDADGPSGFEISYGAGTAHGKVTGHLKPAPAAGDKPEGPRYELRVDIEEWSGGT